MYMNTDIYIYTQIHAHVRVRVCLSFFVVWCRVMSCVARRCWLGGWVWCGAVVVVVVFVLVSGPSHCVVHTGTCGVDTRVFQRVTHHPPHRTHTTPQHKTQHTTTHHNNTTTTPHGDRDRQRQTETERQRKKTETGRQCGGAWLFLVDGVLCLVHPVNARVLSLVNSVKYDCSLISFSAS